MEMEHRERQEKHRKESREQKGAWKFERGAWHERACMGKSCRFQGALQGGDFEPTVIKHPKCGGERSSAIIILMVLMISLKQFS